MFWSNGMSSFNFIKAHAENNKWLSNVLKTMQCFFLKCYVSFHKHVRRLSSKAFITYYAYYQEVHQYLLYGSKGI